MLAADPATIPTAVEECLRWVTPIQQFARTATRDTEVGGVPVAEDDYLVMLYASGNRDEAAFGPTADRFDALRPIEVPNLAFGFGEHLCLGAALARLEARIVFEELLARFPGYEIAGEAEWLPSSLVRGPHAVPIRLRLTRCVRVYWRGPALGEPDVGVGAGDDALQVAVADAASGRVLHPHERLAVLADARQRVGRGAVGEVLALDVLRPAPLAVVLVVEPAVQPGGEMESGVGDRSQRRRRARTRRASWP